MAEFVVHTIPGSPYSRAVMATLGEKHAPWTLAAITPSDTRQEPHLSRHPFSRMPVLQHGDFILYETQAILRYLDRILPDPPLTPTSPQVAARMDQLIGINDSYLFPNCATIIVFQRVVGPALFGTTPDPAAITEAMPRAHLAFAQISRMLGDSTFMTGASISLADLMIAPQLELFSRTPEWKELTAQRDNLADWLQRMEARASLQNTTWERILATA